MNLLVRRGSLDDCAAINDIYNWYVDNSTITFDTRPWDVPRRELWLQQFLPGNGRQDDPGQSLYHLVVATRGDQLLGFAYNGSFRPRDAYRSSTEVTIYTRAESDPGSASPGIGSHLYNELFKHINNTPLHRAYAIIALPNDPSIRFHKKFGFNHIGTLSEVGTKFGRRIDVAWYEKPLN
jgi:phosphinothricin acetyltransferase